MLRPPSIGAPPPTGVFTPLGPPPPFGWGGDWANDNNGNERIITATITDFIVFFISVFFILFMKFNFKNLPPPKEGEGLYEKDYFTNTFLVTTSSLLITFTT
jgi:hypothetical protein